MTDHSTGGYEAAGVVSSTRSPGEGELIARPDDIEVVREWLAIARKEPARACKVLRYPPICMSEIEAIEHLTERVARMEEERQGEEDSFMDAEARAEAWSDRVEIQSMVSSTTLVFAKWASPEILSRFRQQIMVVIQQAFIEGIANESARLSRQDPKEGG